MTSIPVGTKLRITEYVPLPQSRPPEADAHPIISVISDQLTPLAQKIQDLTEPFDIWSVPSEVSTHWEYFLIFGIILVLVNNLAKSYFSWKYKIKTPIGSF